ncbi:DUF2892 domain-containing protein [Gimesia chilikensis]|nr:DUF2892 domain-containing protein [Gimesia chilikensis]
MLAPTAERVPLHTAQDINQRIRRQTEQNIAHYSSADAQTIDRRLKELDQEWDIERTLEANAATAALVGLGLGAMVDRRFFALPAAVAGFLLQHAIQGWCPPLPVFRRLGFRTQTEIEMERYALKAIRGDFEQISKTAVQKNDGSSHDILESMRK